MGTRFLTVRPRLSSRVVARPSEFRRSPSLPGLASPRSEAEPTLFFDADLGWG